MTDDTDKGRISSYEILFKYLRITDDDLLEPGTTPKDNIKHLQGAIRLIQRALVDPNPTLNMLNVYCLFFLGTLTNVNIEKDLKDNYCDGYKAFYKMTMDKNIFYRKISEFKGEMLKRNIIQKRDLDMLQNWDYMIEVVIQSEWIVNFVKNFTKT